MVLARTWVAHAVGMAPMERFKLRRQMAAAPGKKSTTFLSLSMKPLAWKWRRNFLPWPPSAGQKESGRENGTANKKRG